jgi:hypothetical protein
MRTLVGISVFVSILLLGTSGIVQQSYAGNGEVPPSYRGTNCAATHDFTNPGSRASPSSGLLTHGGTCTGFNLNPDTDLNEFFCEDIEPAEAGAQIGIGLTCHVEVPNFDDPFNTKLIRFHVFWDGTVPFLFEPIKPSPSTAATCTFVDRMFIDEISPGLYYEDWICHPNPDNERLWFSLDEGTLITRVIVDSVSFPEVGGIFEGVDTTSLLVAGAQMNAAWMIPVIVAGIGFAIVIARKF